MGAYLKNNKYENTVHGKLANRKS